MRSLRTFLLSSAGVASLGLVLSNAAFAGGVERTGFNSSPLFAKGNVIEGYIARVMPSIEGELPTPLGILNTGEGPASHWRYNVSVKMDLNADTSAMLQYRNAYGASVDFANFPPRPAGVNLPTDAAVVEWDTPEFDVIVKRKVTPNISVYGGARVLRSEVTADLPNIAGYTADAETDWDLGGIIGVAYERPELGLRVSATYSSEVEHEVRLMENSLLTGPSTITRDLTYPQKLEIEGQIGINERTLLFGSFAWEGWDGFSFDAPTFQTLTSGVAVLDYEEDTYTYSLGIGRRITEQLSASLSARYEDPAGGTISVFSGVDGFLSFTAGARVNTQSGYIGAGVTYALNGDGTATNGTQFNDNTTISGAVTFQQRF